MCLSSVSLVLTLWHQNSGKAGRWHSFCREEEAGIGGKHRCSVPTLPEKSGEKIESDLIPGGTGEQRLPSPTEGLAANSAGDMGSEPFSLVLRKTGSVCLPGRCRKSDYWVAYGLSHTHLRPAFRGILNLRASV